MLQGLKLLGLKLMLSLHAEQRLILLPQGLRLKHKLIISPDAEQGGGERKGKAPAAPEPGQALGEPGQALGEPGQALGEPGQALEEHALTQLLLEGHNPSPISLSLYQEPQLDSAQLGKCWTDAHAGASCEYKL